MKIKVTVVGSEAEYQTWLATQAPFVAPAVPAAPAAPATTDSATVTTTPTVALK